MTQRINLYQDSLRPKQDPWSFDRVSQALGLLTLALAIYTAYLGFGVYQATQLWAAQQTELQSQQQKMTELEAQLDQQNQHALLDQQLEQTQQRLSLYQRLSDQITMLQHPEHHPFSGYLTGLAQRPVQGAWLTRIALDEGGASMEIEGRSLSPETVPEMLLQMKSQKVFTGRRFAQMEIQREDETSPVLSFSIRSHLPQESRDAR